MAPAYAWLMDHSPTSSDSFSQSQTTFAQRVLMVLALTLAALLVLVGAGLAFSVLCGCWRRCSSPCPCAPAATGCTAAPAGLGLLLTTLLVVASLGGMGWLFSARIGDQVRGLQQ